MTNGLRAHSIGERRLRVLGLFSGIGGFELGLERAGHKTVFLCERDPLAAAVLRRHFGIEPAPDIRELAPSDLPRAEIVTAGFPCQDLSQAGRGAGIEGERSGLVSHVFRLIAGMRPTPEWLLLENVPFMLSLDGGRAMDWLAARFAELGWAWAYRTVDARSFGLPQRRRRVFILASPRHDPRGVLFADDAGPPAPRESGSAYGFNWTEGRRGLGWAVDAIPPLRAGSGVGIPSPPAIWFPATGEISTPDIRDAERLQGFPPDWTRVSSFADRARERLRWRLVGNSVNVLTVRWLGRRIAAPGQANCDRRLVRRSERWSRSAQVSGDLRYAASSSEHPIRDAAAPLASFLRFPVKPLSKRALCGFLARVREGRLRPSATFLKTLYRLAHEGT